MSKSTKIQWVDAPPPPASHSRSSKGLYHEFFDELRQNPGAWALFPARPATRMTATAIKNGHYKNTKPGEFESVARKAEDSKYDIYVRYVGN